MRVTVFAPRRTAVAALAAALVVAMGCWGAAATPSAQGGKAAPLRIRFAPGHDSATVRGALRGDAQREYVFGARSNQRVTIRLSATPRGTLSLEARRPAGAELVLHKDGADRWSGALPEDGDYEIWVKRESRAQPASIYRLIVTIR
jgi:hypothetical protein